MTREHDFLAAIAAQPDDRAARLVYADWLEEHGDERGELIRIEEELRVLPVHADRYWALKPRRAAVRAVAKKAWLQRLGYTDDYEPVFRDVPDGWKERWRLIREFTERWYGVAMDDVGQPIRDSLQKPKRRQGRNPITGELIEVEFPALSSPELLASLAPSLREWVAYFRELEYKLKSLHRGGGGPDHSMSDHGEGVSFLSFSEPPFSYAVLKTDMNHPDPVVQWSDAEYPESGGTVPRVTTQAFRYLMNNTAGADGFGAKVTQTERLTQQLTDAFGTPGTFDDALIFERRNLLVVLNHDPFWSGAAVTLRVYARKALSRGEFPDFLWELSGRPG